MAMNLSRRALRSAYETADEGSVRDGLYLNWRLILALLANAAIWSKVGQLLLERI